MNRNEIIILVGVLCASAAIWLMSDFANALVFFGLSAILYGIAKAIHDDWFPDLKWDNEPLELMPKGKEATDD